MSDLDHYLETLRSVHEGGDVPFRQYLIPAIGRYRLEYGPDFAEKLAEHEGLGTDRIRFLHAAKFFADGAFIAQLMQLGEPGYIDGHEPQRRCSAEKFVGEPKKATERARRHAGRR